MYPLHPLRTLRTLDPWHADALCAVVSEVRDTPAFRVARTRAVRDACTRLAHPRSVRRLARVWA